MLSVYFAVSPALTLAEVELLAMEKSAPMPDKATD
jgi:hypothetical protein